MKSLKSTILSAGILACSLLGCSLPKLGIYQERPTIHTKGNYSVNCEANKESIDALLSNIWHSGFLKQSEEVREEILNNVYGILNETYEIENVINEELKNVMEVCKERKTRGCFINKKKKGIDYLILNERLFCHKEYNNKGGTEYKRMDEKIEKTLLHELFHDFWFNKLSLEERLEFSLEVEIWFGELDKNSSLYKNLSRIRKNYDENKFFGRELYSIVADKAFTEDIVIPKPLRRFYEKFVSEDK